LCPRFKTKTGTSGGNGCPTSSNRRKALHLEPTLDDGRLGPGFGITWCTTAPTANRQSRVFLRSVRKIGIFHFSHPSCARGQPIQENLYSAPMFCRAELKPEALQQLSAAGAQSWFTCTTSAVLRVRPLRSVLPSMPAGSHPSTI